MKNTEWGDIRLKHRTFTRPSAPAQLYCTWVEAETASLPDYPPLRLRVTAKPPPAHDPEPVLSTSNPHFPA
jgi:hypothetical protein